MLFFKHIAFCYNKEQGTRNKEQGTRNKEQGTRGKGQGARGKMQDIIVPGHCDDLMLTVAWEGALMPFNKKCFSWFVL
jgi:hypothetical protein